MKTRLIHENLDTSFVNLSALIRHLRRREFVGSVRVELSDYEADILLSPENQMRVREHDKIAGRISEGEEALQRLLIRAREPGGIINVYQATEETIQIDKENFAVIENKQPVVNVIPQSESQNGNSKRSQTEPLADEKVSSQPDAISPKPPFEFSNKFEEKAKQTNLGPRDWQTLLNLIAELLGTIDNSLALANLDFTAAFEKARSEISNDYPFLNPSAEIFNYKNGKIMMREQINAKLFAASINEALRRILEKLGKNPKFSNIYRITTQKILALINARKLLYDKFAITPQLEKTIGA